MAIIAPADDPAPPAVVEPLDAELLLVAVDQLVARDPILAGIVERHGPPPLWDRPPGFESLVAIVLEQQVSLRSGAAALERLRQAAGSLEPERVVALGEDGARAAGLTRQKARYVVALARAALDGTFDAEALAAADDETARAGLVRLVGVGGWTADIYLLMALRRPDVWPSGDLALASAMRRATGLGALPTRDEQALIAEAWRPWRSVAARILWHAYLNGER
jgi:DNA-3-methyladenine glycosylase II